MIFTKPTRDQVIALAGLFQACQLVEELARNGSVTADTFATCMRSVFQQNPSSAEQVYGGVDELHVGIKTMHQLLTIQNSGKASDALRYAVGVAHLQGRLMRNRTILNKLSQGIERAQAQAQYFSENDSPETHANVVASLADLYQNTLSTFRYRIQVNGYAGHLQQSAIANRIRALLLAGVRSAVLWKQLGGSRWHLILHRKNILNIINEIQSKY